MLKGHKNEKLALSSHEKKKKRSKIETKKKKKKIKNDLAERIIWLLLQALQLCIDLYLNFCTGVMQLPGRCFELKGWGGDKCRQWHGRKKMGFFATWAIRLCREQSVLGRTDADRNDHLTLCLLSPCKCGPQIAQEKEEKGENPNYCWRLLQKCEMPGLIVARCRSIRRIRRKNLFYSHWK